MSLFFKINCNDSNQRKRRTARKKVKCTAGDVAGRTLGAGVRMNESKKEGHQSRRVVVVIVKICHKRNVRKEDVKGRAHMQTL